MLGLRMMRSTLAAMCLVLLPVGCGDWRSTLEDTARFVLRERERRNGPTSSPRPQSPPFLKNQAWF